MKRQCTKEKKSIKRIAASMMLAAGMCLSLAACGPGDLTDTETSTDGMETMADETKESMTEEPTTVSPIQETEEPTEETIEETTKEITEESTNTIDISAWGEPTEVIGGDWNEDQSWDLLRIYSEEIAMEYGECCIGIQLSISGRPSYIAPVLGVTRFEDFLRGDFDGDKELEYVVAFDLGGSGASGSYCVLLLDYVDNQWVTVTGPEGSRFDGFAYDVVYDTADCGYRVNGKESGLEHFLPWEDEWKDPEYNGGGVTSLYNWTVAEGDDQDRLELWQYVYGDCTSDHVGDVVTTVSIENGVLKLEEEIVVQVSMPLCYVKKIGSQLEVIPIERVDDYDTNRLEELQNEGWDLDEIYYDDIGRYYEVPHYEGMVTVSLQDTTRYYEFQYANRMIRVDQQEIPFREDGIEQSGRYRVYLDGDRVTCIMWYPYQ